jgi:type II secretory ATPase GspE/PulE/Tfp pilus assembly ATPase PilB-like protein
MTGYLGREMISEVFSVDDEISHMIANGDDKYKILEKAKSKGYKTLTDDVVEKVSKEITTISELLRVAKV